MANKYSHDDLIKRVKSPGWSLVTGKDDKTIKGTLEEILRAAHARHEKDEAPGLVKEIETTLELDMIEIEQLWWHLGLPT